MLLDWFEIETNNGTYELINNVRTVTYAQALGITSVKKCECSKSNLYATDSGPYLDLDPSEESSELLFKECIEAIPPVSETCIPLTTQPNEGGTPNPAPWWDNECPASYEFVGLMLENSTGWDSTRTRGFESRAITGSSFGTKRRPGRCITFSGTIIATSLCGLEYALSYYDSLSEELGNCDLFTLHMATCCPPEGEEDLSPYRRHIREASISSGPFVLSTYNRACAPESGCGQVYYADIQFTICSESPWIYKEPECLDKVIPSVDGETADYIPDPCRPNPEVDKIDVEVPRQRYPIRITREGQVCRIGDWDWEETQLSADPSDPDCSGVVVLSDFTVAEEIPCAPYQIIVKYDKDTGEQTFETVRWEHTVGDPLPCDCPIEIVKLCVVNESDEADSAPYQLIDPPTGAGSCPIELTFDSEVGGSWSAVAGEGRELWEYEGEILEGCEIDTFPPFNCTLSILNDCSPEDPDFCSTGGDCPIVIDPLTDTWSPDGSWEQDLSSAFPDPTCNYYISETQLEEPCNRKQLVFTSEVSCLTQDFIDSLTKDPAYKDCIIPTSTPPTLLSPPFETDCFPAVTFPTFVTPRVTGNCLEVPDEVYQKCISWQNRSRIYRAAGILSIDIPFGEDLKNFSLFAWSTQDPIGDPCGGRLFECSDTWGVVIPHLPNNSTLVVDGEISSSTLAYRDSVFPAARYLQGSCSPSTGYLDVGPCEFVTIMIQADTAFNGDIEIDFCFSNYYGASGALGGGGGEGGGAGDFGGDF